MFQCFQDHSSQIGEFCSIPRIAASQIDRNPRIPNPQIDLCSRNPTIMAPHSDLCSRISRTTGPKIPLCSSMSRFKNTGNDLCPVFPGPQISHMICPPVSPGSPIIWVDRVPVFLSRHFIFLMNPDHLSKANALLGQSLIWACSYPLDTFLPSALVADFPLVA